MALMRESWVVSANDGRTDFPLQNLPFGIFSTPGKDPCIGVAIGDSVLNLRACVEQGLFNSLNVRVQKACSEPVLNSLMALGRNTVSAVRQRVMELLAKDAPAGLRNRIEPLLLSIDRVTMHLPAAIGDYTDFYASIYHATNVGRLFRPDNPLLPNYEYVPIGYHGRASSIVISGKDVKRPKGQIKSADMSVPGFGPSRLLDYKLEVGFFVSSGNALGQTIPIGKAEEHIFGLCLLNDWSARDFQAWEYQPLGPFLSKSFHTTISAWIVTPEALAPFRTRQPKRPGGDPRPLPYLAGRADQELGALDLELEVLLLTGNMRDAGLAPHRLS